MGVSRVHMVSSSLRRRELGSRCLSLAPTRPTARGAFESRADSSLASFRPTRSLWAFETVLAQRVRLAAVARSAALSSASASAAAADPRPPADDRPPSILRGVPIRGLQYALRAASRRALSADGGRSS